MALKPLNSIGGFSVGETAETIIQANGIITTSVANLTGNLTAANANLGNLATVNFVNVSTNVNVTGTMQAGNVRTDNLLYANGNAWNFGQDPGGSNTEIQFNDGGNFAGSSAFTFNKSSNVLSVGGNANVGNLGTAQVLATANITTPVVIANIANGTAPLQVNSQTLVANLNADLLDGFNSDTANTGNTIALRNADGNLSANYFIGNGAFLTGVASAGNLANGTSSVTIPSENGNVNTTVGGVANVFVVTTQGANVTGTLGVSGNANVGNIGAAAAVFTTVSGSLLTNAQPNITSVGTLSSLDVTGNVVAGNVYANTGMIAASSLKGEGGNISNIQGGNVSGTVANATHASTANTVVDGNQSNITSVGTLTGLGVNGNITAANITANTGVFTGNGSGLSALEGGNVTGQVGNALVAGTVYTNAQPNITSVGTLSSLAVTGNATAGNVSATGDISGTTLTGTLTTAAQPNVTSVGTLSSLTVTGNIQTSANLITDLIVGRTTSVSIEAAGANSNIFLKPIGTGTVDVWNKIISNVATPVASTDAATKGYVDAAVEGLNIHDAAKAATTGTLDAASGGTVSYNNGTAGVGATLTTTGTYTTIDGVNIASVGTRILVKNEANAAWNGVYTYTSSTVLTRATDYDSVPEVEAGDFIFVQDGTVNNDSGFAQTSTVTTIGTDPIVFVQFSGAGTYSAGTGLTLTGTVFSITNTAVTAGTYGNGDAVATFTVNEQGQLTNAANTVITANAANLSGTTLNANIVNSSLTSVGTLGSLSVSGNASAGNINAGNLLTANFVAGTLTTAAQPNITSVGTLTSLDVSGNANVGNLQIGAGSGGNLTGANVITANLLGGTLTTAAQPNVTSLGTLSGLSVNGNITAANITANTGVFTGNGSGLSQLAGGNVTGQVGNALVAGTVYTAAQPNITSVGTLTSLDVSGAVNASTLASNIAQGTAPITVVSTTKVGNLNADLLDGYDTSDTATNSTVVVRDANANIAANFFIGNGSQLTGIATAGNLANGNSSVTIPAAAGNVLVTVNGNANIAVFTDTGANVNGYLTASGNLTAANANLGNLAVANFVNVASNVTTSGLTVNLELAGNTANFSGNVILPNLTVNTTLAGNVANFTGNLTAANGNLGNLATANYANIASNTITSNLSVNLELAGNTANFTGNVKVNNFTTNLELAGNTANFIGNVVVANFISNGLANVNTFIVTSNVQSNLSPNVNLTYSLGTNAERWKDVYAGNVSVTSNVSAANFTTNGNVAVGNSTIAANTVTTSTTSNTAIASFPKTGITGVDYIVKGIDSSGAKYSIAHITAVTDGTNVDYTTYGLVNLGTTTGTLSVVIDGANIVLQVAASSSNSTVWTTQYRFI